METVKAQELAALTEERAREMIHALWLFATTPPNPLNGKDWWSRFSYLAVRLAGRCDDGIDGYCTCTR